MKNTDEVRTLRRLFAAGHGIVLWVLFLPVLPLLFYLATSEDVGYWAGRGLKIAVASVVLALGLPALGFYFRPTARFYLGSVWIPMAMIALTSLGCRMRAGDAAAALSGAECFDHPEKEKLERAFQAADSAYGTCVSTLAKEPGLPPELLEGVADCPRFRKVSREWQRELGYLESLEQRFPCAGACYGGRRLFEDSGVLAPPCGPFAGQSLRALRTQAGILLGYGIIVILALIPAQFLLLSPLVRRYDSALLSSSPMM